MQKAILVGVNLNENLDFDHSMEELENLAEACDCLLYTSDAADE